MTEEKCLETNVMKELVHGTPSLALALLESTPHKEPPLVASSFGGTGSLANPMNVVRVSSKSTVTHLYAQLLSLAAVLRHQIGYQLSIGSGSQHRQRGAYLDLVWSPLADLGALARGLRGLLTPPTTDIDKLLLERLRRKITPDPKVRTLWYGSFGDDGAAASTPMVWSSLPASRVLPPYRPLELGEDPVYFTRPLIEFTDLSNDRTVRLLHDGLLPRAWRSYLVSIWPRTCHFTLKFPLEELPIPVGADLSVRVTYLGKDLNVHGGDWEEIDRQAMPTRLVANGVEVHPWMDPPETTRSHEFGLPASAFKGRSELELCFQGKEVDKNTYRYVPIPVAELWILARGSDAVLGPFGSQNGASKL
eukprot:TRINITY_DN26058_c0_g1_i1.p1 TRINITY_DN26058_c0_g1~~TRINITY_DN26058_c0_g1_i1.p1  ORF type:complete len:363 (-),score=68.47 TRINITY_DN26058_c0_g1_i1:254-1342(-)